MHRPRQAISLPRLELPESYSNEAAGSFLEEVNEALTKYSAFLLSSKHCKPFSTSILSTARELFALPEWQKANFRLLKKEGSYTGYSLLKNQRDAREQFHIYAGGAVPQGDLRAPNKIPEGLSPDGKKSLAAYFEEMHRLGAFLSARYRGPEFPTDAYDSSYCLLKLIKYGGIASEADTSITGTPAHADWSWITIVSQDPVEGLQIASSDGQWQDLITEPGDFLVLAGELLSLATREAIRPAAHRVVMPDSVTERVSAPFFYTPLLSSLLSPDSSLSESQRQWPDGDHIHRVFRPKEVDGEISFLSAERFRKLDNRWCYQPSCCLS
ncbi:MAG: isopenicillin N synthase family oxygenase [Cyanobacteria bacterium HKST-UBA01]|nr:isopenicillin N synthase family oxygenase [Cyanobacteria bacterium HKST-UBA01]